MIQTHIRDYRKARGMTLAQLAARIGTTPQTISRLETGDMTVSVEWLHKIGAVLEVEPAKLLVPVGCGPANDRFVEMIQAAFIRNRRHVPDIKDAPLEMIAAAGQLADLIIDYAKGLKPFEDIPVLAAAVAAAAMRIGVDGRALGRAVKQAEAA